MQTLFLYSQFVILVCCSEYVGVSKLVRILTLIDIDHKIESLPASLVIKKGFLYFLLIDMYKT